MAGSGRNGRRRPYWEEEQPVEAFVGNVRLRYFENSQRLQVQRTWVRRDALSPDGERLPGKTVTLDVQLLSLSPEAQDLLARVLEDARRFVPRAG